MPEFRVGAGASLDIRNVTHRLRDVEDRIASQALRNGERAVGRLVRDLARRTRLFRDRAGYLRRSIRVRTVRGRVQVVAGSDRGRGIFAAQANILHGGWRPRNRHGLSRRRVRARPFLGIAAHVARRRAPRIMADAIGKSLDRAAQRARRSVESGA